MLAMMIACFGFPEDPRASEANEAELSKIPKALPGAPPLPPGVRERLARELAGRPSDYEPRTENRRPDGSPEYSNRLLLESSPYLKQHAHNPVNWYPWGDEAFEDAKRLDRPVLVSIGYSTCHWCHVMEEESFDTVAAAQYLNAHFIAIKVDREARPDIDAIYMAAVHSMGVSGGWPLNVWVTPDRKPFYGGTYFPPERRGSRPGFIDVLTLIHEQFTSHRDRVDEASQRIIQDVQARLEASPSNQSQSVDLETLERAAAGASRTADRSWGGAGQRNKFPSSAPIRFWLRYHDRTGDPEALTLATLTLEKMAQGGIHDHVGGGFHRYATDTRWLVPHFEKMLYDNALLAVAYLEAGQLTGRVDFTDVTRSTLDYVAAEMTSPEGVFYSATDADSRSEHGESEEGWYFTWTPEEISAVVGAERAPLVAAYYGVTAEGNYEGRSVLHTWRRDADVASQFEMSPEQVRDAIAQARSQLYEARSKRTPPARDDKILVAWNGLMISAFARAGWVLDEARYVEIARRASEFLLKTMWRDGRLVRVYQDGRAGGPAFLEDYAFLIAGLLDLYEADSDPRWLRAAIELQATLDARFADSSEGDPPAGYFQTPTDHEALLAREKPLSDGAIPSGNSVAAMNLLRLAEFTTQHDYEERAMGLLSAAAATLARNPLSANEMLLAVDFFLDPRVEVIVITPADGSGSAQMLRPARAAFLPNRVLTVAADNPELEAHAAVNPLLRGRIARGGKTTVYLCKDRVCGFPTSDPAVFATQIADLKTAQNEP